MSDNIAKIMVFRDFTENYSNDLLQIAYISRHLCILSNPKIHRSEKFSLYLISRINGVKMCKNLFLSQLLEFEATVRPDIACFESPEECRSWRVCQSHVFTFWRPSIREMSHFSVFLSVIVSLDDFLLQNETKGTVFLFINFFFFLGFIQVLRSCGRGSTKNEQSILNLKFFLFKKRTRGRGCLEADKFEQTYYLNDPLCRRSWGSLLVFVVNLVKLFSILDRTELPIILKVESMGPLITSM